MHGTVYGEIGFSFFGRTKTASKSTVSYFFIFIILLFFLLLLPSRARGAAMRIRQHCSSGTLASSVSDVFHLSTLFFQRISSTTYRPFRILVDMIEVQLVAGDEEDADGPAWLFTYLFGIILFCFAFMVVIFHSSPTFFSCPIDF
jgi:hypothetical protein